MFDDEVSKFVNSSLIGNEKLLQIKLDDPCKNSKIEFLKTKRK